MSAGKKVFRCPIHNLISFDKEKDKTLLDIIDSVEFQRLRRIRQLGLSSYTYASSVHDRFSHSLGVAHLVGQLVDNLNIKKPIVINNGEKEINSDQLKTLLQITALLHDIGHGPMSHTFEQVSSLAHEEVSIKLLNEGSISQILNDINDPDLKPNIKKWIKEILIGKGTFSPIWIKELLSSQFDADRLDYLKRDAYMCGVTYAEFDIPWLLHNMEIAEIPNESREGLVINASKGVSSLETYIVSRYHMYEQVYYHKTTRGIEGLIVQIINRLKSLQSIGEIDKEVFLGDSLLKFLIDKNDLASFLNLDDFYFLSHINFWSKNAKDEILKQLCICFIERKLFKKVHEVEGRGLFNREGYDKIKSLFESEDELKYYYFEDQPSHVAYKENYLIGKSKGEQAEHIWLKEKNVVKELSESSEIVKTLRNRVKQKFRAYINPKNYQSFKEKFPELFPDEKIRI